MPSKENEIAVLDTCLTLLQVLWPDSADLPEDVDKAVFYLLKRWTELEPIAKENFDAVYAEKARRDNAN